MDTKLKSDIAESAVTTELLKRGFKVLKPLGDRLPYDVAVDLDGTLIKIQVKVAWYSRSDAAFIVDVRRTRTNRRKMVRQRYSNKDFDFAVICLDGSGVFYVMPFKIFSSFGSCISFVEDEKRQRKPRSAKFRERWDLLSSRAS